MKDNNYKPDPEISKEIKNIRKEVIEKGLNNSEDRFKLLFDFAPDGYYISDLKGNFIDGNKAAERITGYTRAELVGKNYFKTGLLPLKDVPRAVSALKQNRKGLPMEPQEFNLNRKEGTSIDVEISTYPIRINNKIYVLGIARDITKRKQLEKGLKQSEKEKEIVLAISPVHIVYHDLEHNIVWANKAACDSVGKSLKEIKGKKCYQVWAKRDTICRECPIDRAWKTAKMEREEMRTPDNRYWMVTGVPFVNEEGKIIGAVESTMDITILK
ncbi:MAG: PAS domain S-box protein [Atribacterota bacterium]|nr:PAS domain S-box protein [Atribacterota bacterium]